MLRGTRVADRGVPPLLVVEDFDVCEEALSGLGAVLLLDGRGLRWTGQGLDPLRLHETSLLSQQVLMHPQPPSRLRDAQPLDIPEHDRGPLIGSQLRQSSL